MASNKQKQTVYQLLLIRLILRAVLKEEEESEWRSC